MHVNSGANRLSDALSRMAEGYVMPAEVAHAPCITLAARDHSESSTSTREPTGWQMHMLLHVCP
eukprot:5825612-Amphidinium_carterae.1